MAHNLNTNEKTGETSFFSVKAKAWHGLGKIVQDAPNSSEAIKLAGLDFEVEKRPLFTEHISNPSGLESFVTVPDKFATVRKDNNKIFGVVGNQYTIVQNRDAFDFFDSIIDIGEAKFETAGALYDGQIIFITAKLPNHLSVNGSDDLIEQYLFLTSSHDGSGAIQAAFTPVRIVCNNTLNAALRQTSNKVTIRHTVSAHDRLKNAHKVMGISSKLATELQEVFTKMARVRITDTQLKDFIKKAMCVNKESLSKMEAGEEIGTRLQNMTNEIFEYAMTSPTQQMDTTRGTAFGAYNSITGYFQNVKTFDNGDDKLYSILNGTGSRRQQVAFDLAMNFN